MLQTIIQEELQKLIKILPKRLILKTKSPVRVSEKHEIENNNSIGICVFSYEKKKKHPIYVSNMI